jgi:wobble nucleotide-excising tRNase
MLKKIISIKNVGRFRNSAASGNPQLAKRTLIVGANGFGKTTICAVLRSLKTGDPSHIIGRRTLGVVETPTVELLIDADATRFDGKAWSSPCPAIEIFDGVFVAENVHSGEVVDIDHKRNFYRIIVGQEGIKLADEDATLAGQSREMTAEITSAVKALQPHLPAGMKLETFLALPDDADIDRLITDQERTLQGIQNAAGIKARAPLSEFPIPALPEGFSTLLSRSIDDIAQDAETLVSRHLAAHEMSDNGGNWVAQGIDHAAKDTCPFCGQGIKGLPLITAYRALFSDRYKALGREIAATREVIARAFGDGALARLDIVTEQNKGGVEFWARHCTFDANALDFPGEAAIAFRSLGRAALSLLERKARTPLEVVPIDGALTIAMADYDAARAQVEALNVVIRSVNALIAAKKAEIGSADVKAAETELARRKGIKTRHAEKVAPLCAEYGRLVTAKEEIEKRRTAVREQLDKHTDSVVKPYERRINELLEAFNAGFTITETRHSYPGGVATSTYQLVINRTAVDVGDGKTPTDKPSFKNTLSSGDRTTLALAFFLAHLERDAELATKIVVFDDPFNSQDAFRRRQTIHEIVKLAGTCGQVIVLSHDPTFLKQIWDKAPAAERVALAIADHRAQGSKLLPVDLEKATQGRTANDIDDLQTYQTTGAGNRLDVVRKMRVVLETYCRTTYPTSFLAADWLGDIVGKIRDGGDAHPAAALYEELDQINDYTKQYHHGEDVADTTPDEIDSTELTGYARRTLKIVNALLA